MVLERPETLACYFLLSHFNELLVRVNKSFLFSPHKIFNVFSIVLSLAASLLYQFLFSRISLGKGYEILLITTF